MRQRWPRGWVALLALVLCLGWAANLWGQGGVRINGIWTASPLNIGTNGVKISGDGDGAITFLGLGDGSDEDLTLNLDDTADTVAVSSSTGVTNINFGAIKAVLPEGSRTAVALQFGTGNEGISAITSSGRLGLSAGGLNSALVVSGLGALLPSNGILGFTTGLADTTDPDVALSRGAANIIALASGDSFNLVGGGGSLRFAGVVTVSSTAPTIASGFGTTPTIAASNGTAAFTVDVGTGGTASAGVVTLPASTTGWNCSVENRTGAAANRADQRTVQTATTTTSVTVQNQTISSGAALAWTASDVLALHCLGY